MAVSVAGLSLRLSQKREVAKVRASAIDGQARASS
jgi:hypothetical protein